MNTIVLTTDPGRLAGSLATAAAILLRGGLVAFPTETVYGLGADATSAAAVERIYLAKGRPHRNPIIVHVADTAVAQPLVTHWPEAAARLASRFWPGPLTLVLPRSAAVPDVVSGGGPTVAVRVPAHPVALALLEAVQRPLAAPSANRSNRLSPT
ncbi:MAG TPA: L-threonylcarbamoyladenylate synthase, partial [Gemmatales bacterium]|nr:L-threonylcarbamoyladenylate synthase [Gemmatales bacterium]